MSFCGFEKRAYAENSHVVYCAMKFAFCLAIYVFGADIQSVYIPARTHNMLQAKCVRKWTEPLRENSGGGGGGGV